MAREPENGLRREARIVRPSPDDWANAARDLAQRSFEHGGRSWSIVVVLAAQVRQLARIADALERIADQGSARSPLRRGD